MAVLWPRFRGRGPQDLGQRWFVGQGGPSGDREMRVRDIDDIAKRQHGLITRPPTAGLDLPDAEIDGLVRRRLLVRVRTGVYRLVGAPEQFPVGIDGRDAGLRNGLGLARLRCPSAPASRLRVEPGSGDHRASRLESWVKGVRVVESRLLPKDAHRHGEDVPSLSTARTICDLAGDLDPFKLERLVDDCLVRRRIKLAVLQATFETLDRPRRKGRATLRRVLNERDKGGGFPESELEARFLNSSRNTRFGRPVVQGTPPWLEAISGRVDCMYPDQRQIFELDGRPWHLRDADQERDLRRDHAATLAGWNVTRFSWRQVVHAGDYVIEVVRNPASVRAGRSDEDRVREADVVLGEVLLVGPAGLQVPVLGIGHAAGVLAVGVADGQRVEHPRHPHREVLHPPHPFQAGGRVARPAQRYRREPRPGATRRRAPPRRPRPGSAPWRPPAARCGRRRRPGTGCRSASAPPRGCACR